MRCRILLPSCPILEQSPFKPHSQIRKQYCCQNWTIVIVSMLACPKHKLNVLRQHKMQQLQASWNVTKLVTSRLFSKSFSWCPFKTASTMNFFLPDLCRLMETLLSTPVNSFTLTAVLALSDQHLDLFLLFPGPGILILSVCVCGGGQWCLRVYVIKCLWVRERVHTCVCVCTL